MGSSSSVNSKPNTTNPPKTTSESQLRHETKSTGFKEKEIRRGEGHVTESYSPSPDMYHPQSGGNWNRAYDGYYGNPYGSQQPALHGVVNAAVNADSVPKYDHDAIVFETFFHANGTEYSVIYQDGQRFMINPQTQDMIPFPAEWYSLGLLVTQEPVSSVEVKEEGKSEQQLNNPVASTSHDSTPSTMGQPKNSQQQNKADDRSSYIDHPTKGRIKTYMAKEKRNVIRYYDETSGEFVILPLAWEIHSSLVKEMLSLIKDVCPAWTDVYEIIACLRACNYDVEYCMESILVFQSQGLGQAAVSVSTKDVEIKQKIDREIADLKSKLHKAESKIESTEKKLQEEATEKLKAHKQISELQERCSTLEVKVKQLQASLTAAQRPRTAKTVKVVPQVDPSTMKSMNNNIRELHKTHVKFKMDIRHSFDEIRNLISKSLIGIKQISKADSGISTELDEVRELYRKEVLQRRLLYNKVQELRGNIRVFARCRYDSRADCCLQFPSDFEFLVPTANGNKKFKFDKVFNPKSTQDQVFEDTKPIITSCVDGYNVCILAYGQTGSGKTFTMMGPPDNPGVNVRSIRELLCICQNSDTVDYTLKVGMIEIYNENVQDLLSKDIKTITVQQQGTRVHLPGMVEMPVRSMDDIMTIINTGNKNRATASTKMNSESSRSHLVIMIAVDGIDKISGAHSKGSLMLCDLAGSERVGKTEATGQRLVEAANINKSLTALGQVFAALRMGHLHVPYRNSKLTHLLQPALGGDAKACLFVAVSPDIDNVTETISSLQFGSNARQVQLGQAKQNITKGQS